MEKYVFFCNVQLAVILVYSFLQRFSFKIWNIVFVLVRLASAVLAVLTLWYGLRSNETPYVDPVSGNFNTAFIR